VQFLANENISLDAVEAIRRIGHDVAWIRTDAPGAKIVTFSSLTFTAKSTSSQSPDRDNEADCLARACAGKS
jgi:hypothetical protein